MEDRKPYKLREVLIVYNFLQVLFSSWLFYEACTAGWFNGYSYTCQPVDYSKTPEAIRVSLFIIIIIICFVCIYSNLLPFLDGFWLLVVLLLQIHRVL